MKVFLLILLLFAAAQAMLLKAEEGGAVAVRVNGTGISQLRVERYFAEYLEDQGRALTSIRSPSLYQRLREQALEQLIAKELLWQEARRRGIEVDEASVQARLAELRRAFPEHDGFARALANAGFDEASFADYTRHEIAAQQVWLLLGQIEPPTDEAVRAFEQERRQATANGSNQSVGRPVEQEQGFASSKNLLFERQQAQARQTALQRLREEARIERSDTR
ncbi:MAG: SurA N-terminal domain-containing protein [Pseudomonas sp.]|uniref:SurA N-terminal domain-containing protein n=1 Tax=Pseudomonas sp. TaxID=306 RepID=UPI003D105677